MQLKTLWMPGANSIANGIGTKVVGFLLLGYLSMSRSFAYFGVPALKVFIGEVVLGAFFTPAYPGEHGQMGCGAGKADHLERGGVGALPVSWVWCISALAGDLHRVSFLWGTSKPGVQLLPALSLRRALGSKCCSQGFWPHSSASSPGGTVYMALLIFSCSTLNVDYPRESRRTPLGQPGGSAVGLVRAAELRAEPDAGLASCPARQLCDARSRSSGRVARMSGRVHGLGLCDETVGPCGGMADGCSLLLGIIYVADVNLPGPVGARSEHLGRKKSLGGLLPL